MRLSQSQLVEVTICQIFATDLPSLASTPEVSRKVVSLLCFAFLYAHHNWVEMLTRITMDCFLEVLLDHCVAQRFEVVLTDVRTSRNASVTHTHTPLFVKRSPQPHSTTSFAAGTCSFPYCINAQEPSSLGHKRLRVDRAFRIKEYPLVNVRSDRVSGFRWNHHNESQVYSQKRLTTHSTS